MEHFSEQSNEAIIKIVFKSKFKNPKKYAVESVLDTIELGSKAKKLFTLEEYYY